MNQTIQLNTNHSNRGNSNYSEISRITSRVLCLIHKSACYFFMSREKRNKYQKLLMYYSFNVLMYYRVYKVTNVYRVLYKDGEFGRIPENVIQIFLIEWRNSPTVVRIQGETN